SGAGWGVSTTGLGSDAAGAAARLKGVALGGGKTEVLARASVFGCAGCAWAGLLGTRTACSTDGSPALLALGAGAAGAGATAAGGAGAAGAGPKTMMGRSGRTAEGGI